jgi:hypothetical protein
MRKHLVLLTAALLSGPLMAQEVATAVAGQKANIPIRIKAEMACSIEVTIGSRKEMRVAEPPNYEATVEFQSDDPGVSEIRWEGKFRARGLRSTPACPGSGVVRVTTAPNTEQRKAEWARVFAPLRPEQRTCLQVGLTHRGVKFESTDPQASLDAPTTPGAREVFAKCDSFFMVPRVWGVNDPSDYPCALPGGLKSRCSGNYAERLPDGRLAPISLEKAIVAHLDGKSWTTEQRESDAVREARDRAAREEQSRREAELAAKRQAEERERQARAEAEERDRRLKESPEYRRQQAELERRRVAEMLAAEEKTRREKEQLEQAARLARQEAERRRVAEQAAAEERARIEREQAEQAEQAARLARQEAERRRAAEQAAAEERARIERERAEQVARQRRQDEERRLAERTERERAERARLASTFPYYALVTCGFRGQHTNVLACFAGRVGTELELRNGQRYGLYKVHEISSLGQETREGLRIDLQRKFELRAQNSDDTLILGVKIIDRTTNETLFEKQVGRFGVISIKD